MATKIYMDLSTVVDAAMIRKISNEASMLTGFTGCVIWARWRYSKPFSNPSRLKLADLLLKQTGMIGGKTPRNHNKEEDAQAT